MSCLLCDGKRLLFGEYEAPYCIFHNSEEVVQYCAICHQHKLFRRSAVRCSTCSFSYEVAKTKLIVPRYLVDSKKIKV